VISLGAVADIFFAGLESIDCFFQGFRLVIVGPFQFGELSIGFIKAPSKKRSAKPLAFDLSIDAKIAFAV
jgi:hypothetical protein